MNSKTSQIVAIKVLQLDTSDLDIPEIIAEISSMQQCASQFISKYYSSFVYQEALWIVIEFAACGSLRSIVNYYQLSSFIFSSAWFWISRLFWWADHIHYCERYFEWNNVFTWYCSYHPSRHQRFEIIHPWYKHNGFRYF